MMYDCNTIYDNHMIYGNHTICENQICDNQETHRRIKFFSSDLVVKKKGIKVVIAIPVAMLLELSDSI